VNDDIIETDDDVNEVLAQGRMRKVYISGHGVSLRIYPNLARLNAGFCFTDKNQRSSS
jgi:hypothetical protein